MKRMMSEFTKSSVGVILGSLATHPAPSLHRQEDWSSLIHLQRDEEEKEDEDDWLRQLFRVMFSLQVFANSIPMTRTEIEKMRRVVKRIWRRLKRIWWEELLENRLINGWWWQRCFHDRWVQWKEENSSGRIFSQTFCEFENELWWYLTVGFWGDLDRNQSGQKKRIRMRRVRRESVEMRINAGLVVWLSLESPIDSVMRGVNSNEEDDSRSTVVIWNEYKISSWLSACWALLFQLLKLASCDILLAPALGHEHSVTSWS
jgi:hypothetical protein